jgi:hypothetical protein
VAKLSFRALDAEQQRLVGDYQPVSSALTGYELAYRSWRGGQLTTAALRLRAQAFSQVVARSIASLRGDHASGADVAARRLLVAGLEARQRALAKPPASRAYRSEWNRSVVDARRALTLMQDLRDGARLIPLPEDAVS